MVEIAFSTDFAEVRFWAKGENLIGEGRINDVCPEPEQTVRIDCCHLGKLVLNCEAGSIVEVGLDYLVKDGWTVSEEGGEAFMCSLFEHRDGHQAAIGLRDYDWLADNLDLTVLSSAKLPSKPWAKFQANTPAERELEVSLAITKSPIDEFEALSPWRYVDKALKF